MEKERRVGKRSKRAREITKNRNRQKRAGGRKLNGRRASWSRRKRKGNERVL
jgi:hypothetical protein